MWPRDVQLLKEMIVTFLPVFPSGRCRRKILSDTHPFQCSTAAYPSRNTPCLCGRTGYCRPSYQGKGSSWRQVHGWQAKGGRWKSCASGKWERGRLPVKRGKLSEEQKERRRAVTTLNHSPTKAFLAFSITLHPEYHGPLLTSELLPPVLLHKPHSRPPQPICSVRWSLHWIFLASLSHLLWPILLLP